MDGEQGCQPFGSWTRPTFRPETSVLSTPFDRSPGRSCCRNIHERDPGTVAVAAGVVATFFPLSAGAASVESLPTDLARARTRSRVVAHGPLHGGAGRFVHRL